MAGIPKGPQIKKMCNDLGCFTDFVRLRERYKLEGLIAKEAIARAYAEMGIAEKWSDWRARKTAAEIRGEPLPATPEEVREGKPSYKMPSMTKGASYGNELLDLAKEVQWVKEHVALVGNGEPLPKHYPNKNVLFWFQQVLALPPEKRTNFFLSFESQVKGGEDAWMRDGEYQMAQIEDQLKQALVEVGSQLREYETDLMAETLDGTLQASPEGAGVESAVPA